MSHSQAESPQAAPTLVPPDPNSAGPKPVEIFYSYAHEDQELQKSLRKHLANMKRQGIIAEWYDRDISAGDEWNEEINKHLNSASVILLLISPDFMDSDYSNNVEVNRAMQRHDAGEARVIPIILRPVDWEGAPFSKLQSLPEGAEAVTSWDNEDEAFLSVARGIRRALKELSKQPGDVIYESYGRHIERGWLKRWSKPLWIAAAILLVFLLAMAAYKLKRERSWTNFFSTSAETTPTPTPSPTTTVTPTPTPTVTPTPPDEPSPSPTARPSKTEKPRVTPRPTPKPDPDAEAIRRYFRKKPKQNAHASPIQSTQRVTMDTLKRLLEHANRSREARRELKEGLKKTGVDFVLTAPVEEELRAYASGYSKAELDALIAVIRANDWKKSEEARLIPLQIAREIDQLVVEFDSIPLANLDQDIRIYNDLLNKCSTTFGRVDTQVKRFDLKSQNQFDWNRYRKPWKRANTDYDGLEFKREVEASTDLLKKYLGEIKQKINNAILGVREPK